MTEFPDLLKLSMSEDFEKYMYDYQVDDKAVEELKWRGYWAKPVTRANRYYDTFGTYFPDLSGKSILDAGCSIGWTTSYLKGKFPDAKKIVGLDLFHHRLIGAREFAAKASLARNMAMCGPIKKEGLHFVAGDFYNAPFKEPFDAVLCMNNLLFMCSPDTFSFYKHAHQFKPVGHLVKEGGVLVASYMDFGITLRKKEGGFTLESMVHSRNLTYLDDLKNHIEKYYFTLYKGAQENLLACLNS